MSRSLSTAARLFVASLACTCLVASCAAPAGAADNPSSPSAKAAAAPLDTTPDPWKLGDDIGARVDSRWNAARGVYMNARGFPDTRLNSLLLQLMSMAALANHQGAIRHDERIEPLVRVLTSPPVLVTRSLKAREVGHFPHAPAWTPAIGEDPEQATLHPSIDTSVVRALTAAWRVRDIIHMDPAVSARIGQVLISLAQSPFYRAPSRALNQINWHAEVYAATFEVTGDTGVLADYREQLAWFANYAHKPDPKVPGGSPNLTSGSGFRYLPNRSANAQLNKVETTEYGNLALGSLGFYNKALRGGMKPLAASQVKTLQAWSKHMLLGSWTHAGYPNWDTGLGTKRRHLRQYWAWSLDGMMTASGPDALLGYPGQRAYVRSIAQHGVALYLKTAWSSTMDSIDGPLPVKTSFGAPNGFTSGAGNELIGPLRFAIIDASLDGRFQDVNAVVPPNWFGQDKETGRFALSTATYNGAILPSRAGQSQGGIEPVRLFDGQMRPLTSLGGRGTGSLGVAVVKDGLVRVDTEPGTPTRQRTTDVKLLGLPANTSSSFTKNVAVSGTASSRDGRIAVKHVFSKTAIDSAYNLTKLTPASQVSVRVPLWGLDSKLDFVRGAVRKGGRWVRSQTPLTVQGVTADGGKITVTLTGIPHSARLALVEVRPDGYRPKGARELVVLFKTPKSHHVRLQRQIVIAPS